MLKAESPISGEVMSKKLGVSRNAIWKQVNNLRDLEYEITAETNVGYSLTKIPDYLWPFELWPYLKTNDFGQQSFRGYELSSTNAKAKELARKKAEEGTIVLAESQSKGRGRRGRAWQSEPTKGIYLSLILRPSRPLAEASPYTFLGAYGVLRVCQDLGLKPVVKWPNDIYVQGKKISGVLAELSAIGQDIGYIVLGIGLNVNQSEFAPDIPGTSLSLELGRELSRVDVLANLLYHLEIGYEKLKTDTEWLVELMRQNSLLLGKEVIVTGGIELEGIAEDIAEDGALLVRTKEGIVKVWAGDVSVREKRV